MKLHAAALVLVLTGVACGQGRALPKSPIPDETGPEVVILDQVAGCYGSVRFDHRLHVSMAPIQGGCKNCHHDLTEEMKGGKPEAMRPCRTCHEPTSAAVTADKPGLRGAYHRQCLSCHKDWSHENACGFCHADSNAMRGASPRLRSPQAALDPRSRAQGVYLYQTGHKSMPLVTFHHDDHSGKFGLQCVDCHAGASCGSCHGEKSERPVVNRQQSCYKCHAETRCVTCHDLRERGGFEHGTRTLWWLRPAHAALACDACHDSRTMPRRPSSDSCQSCHAQRWGDLEFDHSRTGVLLEGDHARFECLECHRGGDKRMAARCSSCHFERAVPEPRRVGRDPDVRLAE